MKARPILFLLVACAAALAACSGSNDVSTTPSPDAVAAGDDSADEKANDDGTSEGGAQPTNGGGARDASKQDGALPPVDDADAGPSPAAAPAGLLSSAVRATCLVTPSQAVKCWGEGAFGIGPGLTTSLTPVTVPGVTATRVSIGGGFGCAVTPGGTAKCWGSNAGGQLGNGSTSDSYTSAVDVIGLTNVTDISAEPAMGTPHACAIAGGATRCWGGNTQGAVGNGTVTYTTVLTPVGVIGLGSNSRQVVAGFGRSCSLTTSGAVKWWGADARASVSTGTPNAVPDLSSGVVAVDAEMNGCALLDTGAIKCWGVNGFGELGAGYFGDPPDDRPVDVVGIGPSHPAAAISVGPYDACALMADGTVRCWGFGAGGVLGNGSKSNSNVPVTVQGISTAVAVAVGSQHACALLASGAVKCWGQNDKGQLGNGGQTESLTPVDVTGL